MDEKKGSFKPSLGLAARSAFAAVAGLLFCILPTRGTDSTIRLCFPNSSWFGNAAPNVNNDIHTDPGWQGAFQYAASTGSPLKDVVIRGIRDSSNLYISVEANNQDTPTSLSGSTATLVVLTFDPGDGNASDIQRLHIYPVNGGTLIFDRPVAVNSFEYWGHGLSALPVTSPPTLPSWLATNVKVTYHQDSTFHWYLAIKIPFKNTPNGSTPSSSDQVQVPTGGTFGLYMDVFRVTGGGYSQSSWPPTQPETGCTAGAPPGTCTPGSGIPSSSVWGTSTIDATQTCSLVNIDGISVTNGTNPAGGIKIDLFTPNVFNANVTNSPPPASTGLPDNAKQVSATFSIWNLGIAALPQWQTVPTGHNPTTAIDLPPGPKTLNPDPWTVAPADQPKYDPAHEFDSNPATRSHPHQCIKVQLTSNDLNTAFTNNPAFQNMDFVDASKFRQIAEINAKGFPQAPGQPDQVFDLLITITEEVLKPSQTALPSAYEREKKGGRVVSRLTWIAEACRHTGYFMTIKDQTRELCDPVGAFGYFVKHEGKGPVERWQLQFTGTGLEKVPGRDDLYRVHVPKDGVVTVTTSGEPVEQAPPTPSKMAVFLDAGAGVPHGTFGNAFNTGFSFNAGLEYIATSYFSVEGIFGFHHFPAKVGSSLDVYQFSGNGKFYLTSSGPFRPFVNGGIGGYKFSPGSTYFGGNFGGGILRQFGPHWGLQASYNFHAVNTPVTATKFSTVQGGVRFVF